MTNLINKQVGGFTVIERIGRGGMASVYRAHQSAMNRDVALKVIEMDDLLERGDEFKNRFAQEAAVVASLEHIHVLPVYDYGIQDNIIYLAMRLLRGGTLAEIMGKGQLPIARAVELFSQVARGLAYAHSKGVVHRDLKPSNIMLDDVGNAHLTDFGLAKWIYGAENITRTGNIVGTPAYMSPEQLRGDGVDHRSDIYSMGIILYQMLAGKPPFDSPSSNVVSIIYQHLEKMPQAPSVHNSEITPEIEMVMLKAIAKNPDDRFQSMGEMDKALREAAGMTTSPTASYPVVTVKKTTGNNPQIPPRLADKAQTNNTFLLIGGIISGLFIIGVILFTLSSNAQNSANQEATRVAQIAIETRQAEESQIAQQTQIALQAQIAVQTQIALDVVATQTQQAVQATQTIEAVRNLNATILRGERGDVEDTIPTPEEIALAQMRVGDGFIAILACNRTSEYHSGSVREIGDFLRGYNIQSRVYDADNNENRQPSLVEQARSDGAVGFVICPLNANIMDGVLSDLDEANIPLTLYAGNAEGFGYGGIVTVGDDYELGYKPGQFAGQIIADELNGEANVVILDYPDLPAIVERADGLEAGVLSIAPNATIIGRYLGGTEDFGRASIAELVSAQVEIDVIVSINDAGSLG
ncbi:MAG: bifunctional serine/threonine-protein kinase/ABC transporter substrate-binding protein, partial [Anaerolineae bacterium]|nr:bifunctional serine/threonine-protein kinase/ABC transporter substrate-binding protein [Anaerolineae bacterium]